MQLHLTQDYLSTNTNGYLVYGANPKLVSGSGTAKIAFAYIPTENQFLNIDTSLAAYQRTNSLTPPGRAIITYDKTNPHKRLVHAIAPCINQQNFYFLAMQNDLESAGIIDCEIYNRFICCGATKRVTKINYDKLAEKMVELYWNIFKAIAEDLQHDAPDVINIVPLGTGEYNVPLEISLMALLNVYERVNKSDLLPDHTQVNIHIVAEKTFELASQINDQALTQLAVNHNTVSLIEPAAEETALLQPATSESLIIDINAIIDHVVAQKPTPSV